MNLSTRDGRRIVYRIDGPREPAPDAKTIVLINSLGTTIHMWEPQLPSLDARMGVVRYDQRGHGQSESAPGPYSVELLGLDLLDLVDALAVRRVYLCGLSLGGMVALWFAAHFPERVERAVFADTAARIGTAEGWNARIAAVKRGGMASIRDMVVNRFLSREFCARRPEVASLVGEMVEATDPDGYMASCAALRDADLSPLLSRIQAPSLVLSAELDESTPTHQGRELHEAIRGSRFVVLKEAAHLSNLEQSDLFNRYVTEFIHT